MNEIELKNKLSKKTKQCRILKKVIEEIQETCYKDYTFGDYGRVGVISELCSDVLEKIRKK